MNSSFAKQALEEYNGEIAKFHGGIDGRPFWNVHSSQFTYNPKLVFTKVPAASYYIFTATDENGNKHSFKSQHSTSLLTEIWKDIPTGMVELKVDAYDKDDNFIAVSGMRTFFKCDPFPGRENLPPKAYSYRECALKAYRYAFSNPASQYFLKNGKPDPEYDLNVYPSKMHSRLITSMITYAKLEPENAEMALELAKKVADYLLTITCSDDEPLAGLPHTYSIDYLPKGSQAPIGVAGQRLGNIMMIYPCEVADAYLDLEEVTGDKKYYDAALKIANYYRDNVLPNGTWYLYVSMADGKPVAENYCMPNTIINLISRMYKKTGDKVWKDIEEGCFNYINKVCVEQFNWEGQFEDTPLTSNYENLTHFIALSLIRHIAKTKADDPKEVEKAVTLIRYAEDQFVIWGKFAPRCSNTSSDTNEWHSPAGLEQYEWYLPIDSSTSYIASAFMDVYKLTGDKLWYEKSCALADNITRMQNPETGLIPTHWVRKNAHTDIYSFWINCHLGTAKHMYYIAENSDE